MIGVKISIAVWVMVFLPCAAIALATGESVGTTLKFVGGYASFLLALGWLLFFFAYWIGIPQ